MSTQFVTVSEKANIIHELNKALNSHNNGDYKRCAEQCENARSYLESLSVDSSAACALGDVLTDCVLGLQDKRPCHFKSKARIDKALLIAYDLPIGDEKPADTQLNSVLASLNRALELVRENYFLLAQAHLITAEQAIDATIALPHTHSINCFIECALEYLQGNKNKALISKEIENAICYVNEMQEPPVKIEKQADADNCRNYEIPIAKERKATPDCVAELANSAAKLLEQFARHEIASGEWQFRNGNEIWNCHGEGIFHITPANLIYTYVDAMENVKAEKERVELACRRLLANALQDRRMADWTPSALWQEITMLAIDDDKPLGDLNNDCESLELLAQNLGAACD